MKKVVLTVFAVVSLLFANSQAQVLKGYGVKAGITSSTEALDYSNGFPVQPSKRRVGFNVAVYAEWLNIPFLSVITQLEYKQGGYLQEFSVPPSPSTSASTILADNRVDYLSIPILAKFTFPAGDFHPYVLAGPRFDFQLGYHRTIVFNDPSLAPPYDHFKKSLLGGSFGLGTQVCHLTPVPLLVELRYNPDFSDSYQEGGLSVRNNAYDIWVGVEF